MLSRANAVALETTVIRTDILGVLRGWCAPLRTGERSGNSLAYLCGFVPIPSRCLLFSWHRRSRLHSCHPLCLLGPRSEGLFDARLRRRSVHFLRLPPPSPPRKGSFVRTGTTACHSPH